MVKRVSLICILALLLASIGLARIRDGSKDVSAAGTAEALTASPVRAVWVTVQAKTDNTGYVYVGASTVSGSRGVQLAAGDSITFPVVEKRYTYDLSTIYVDAATNGDGVVWVAEVRP